MISNKFLVDAISKVHLTYIVPAAVTILYSKWHLDTFFLLALEVIQRIYWKNFSRNCICSKVQCLSKDDFGLIFAPIRYLKIPSTPHLLCYLHDYGINSLSVWLNVVTQSSIKILLKHFHRRHMY